jgi:hypothetical protein
VAKMQLRQEVAADHRRGDGRHDFQHQLGADSEKSRQATHARTTRYHPAVNRPSVFGNFVLIVRHCGGTFAANIAES